MAVKNASPFLFSYTPYLSQGYNEYAEVQSMQWVVVPYYLSQGYNMGTAEEYAGIVVIPYYLSQGYNATRK